MLIHNKDDIEFVTEFPCFLGHPVLSIGTQNVQKPEKLQTMRKCQLTAPLCLLVNL